MRDDDKQRKVSRNSLTANSESQHTVKKDKVKSKKEGEIVDQQQVANSHKTRLHLEL